MKSHTRRGLAAILMLCTAAAAAQTVTMNGSLGTQQALLVIDGQPHAVAVGSTVKGVKLLSLTASQAEVEVGGARRMVTLGAGPVRMTGGGGGGSSGCLVC